MIIIIRALSQCGKDDGDYDSPTSRDENSDFTKRKKIRKKQKGQKREGQRRKGRKKKDKKKMREKERRDNATISFSTLVLQNSTMIFMI